MKKTSYHVNPAVNKWEEEQRRARMEKMIQRAKSTLPPEARGGAKTSGPKKPSPYSAENNAAKLVRKRSTTGGQGTPSGPAPVDVEELDSLIYNRVQEILGMPLMQRAAAARAASRGGGAPRPPASGRGGRRPAWNDDWNGQTASAPSHHEERHTGSVGSRSGASNTTAYERSPSKSSAAPKPRPSATHGTQQRTSPSTGPAASRIPAPVRIEAPTNPSGGLHRRTSGRAPGAAEERVVLLPSPSPAAAAAASRGPLGARPGSSRYGSGAGAAAAAAGDPGAAAAGASGHLLEQSVVAAIEALNPHAPAAREAASRIAHHQHMQQGSNQGGERLATAVPSVGSGGGAMGISSSFRGSGAAAGTAAAMGASSRHLSGSASVFAAVGSRDASLMQSASLTATAAAAGGSQGGSPGTGTSVTGSSLRRPPLAPGLPRASGRGVPLAAGAGHHHYASNDGPTGAAAGDEEEDAYADDAFEEYEGTDDEGAAREAEAASAGHDEGEEGDQSGGEGGGAAGVDPDVVLLRDSVNALNGLVQLKIQQELVRSQQQQQSPGTAQPESSGGGSARGLHGPQGRLAAAAAGPDVLASLALVGSEEPDGRGAHGGPGRGDPANSSLGDGLRQSDLDYLARLGGGDPHDGGELATSTDERPFVIEPGAPAGTAKAWGDRQPWAKGKDGDSTATGLAKLRERQEREKQQQQQQRLSQQGLSGAEGGSRQARLEQADAPQSGRGSGLALADEEDSVLLGETLTPRRRSGAAAQMQAVSSALAALASSGQLGAEEAKDLRSQTDALYGSLVQLHHLMNGPRGAELYSSPSPSSSNGGGGSGGARGFTPPDMSPSDSPSQTARRQSAALGASPAKPAQVALEPLGAQSGGGEGAVQQLRKPPSGGGVIPGNSSHLQLTPKHQLIPEDVAWMAGLVHSLSRSLRVEKDEVELS
ncbi:hypothetical protein PLESTM_001899100 [Pleodorina starrii]|nr:hypothetical protein PLESTM_001899100 [Pleodorina starrii]